MPVLGVANLTAILNGPRLNVWQRFIAPEDRVAASIAVSLTCRSWLCELRAFSIRPFAQGLSALC